MPLIKGSRLTRAQREIVLATYLYRWTRDNPRREDYWRGIAGKPTMPLVSDAEWLADHAFHFIADGSRLHARHRHCEPAYMAEESSEVDLEA